jgi:hypothetical protein
VQTTTRNIRKAYHVKFVLDTKTPKKYYAYDVARFDGLRLFKKCENYLTDSHRRNISLVLITENVFRQVPSSCGISLNSKYIFVSES